MKAVLLLALPLVAFAQYYVPTSQWPVYLGALPIRQPIVSIPGAYDRAAMFWFAMYRANRAIYTAFNQDIGSPINHTSTKGDVLVPRVHGYNTLRSVRAHVNERLTDRTCSALMTLTTAPVFSQHRRDCSGNSTNEDDRHARFYNITVQPYLFEFSSNRNFLTGIWAPIYAPKLAMFDVLCQGTWDSATSKFVNCKLDPDRDSEFLSTSANEVSCGVESENFNGVVQNISGGCLQVMATDTNLGTGYKEVTMGVTSVVHQPLQTNGVISFVASIATGDSMSVLATMYWEDGSSAGMSQTSSFIFYWLSPWVAADFTRGSTLAGQPINGFNSATGCKAYRVKACFAMPDGSNDCRWYPGGGVNPNGWLKTYGLGNCTQNYCPCLNSEGPCCEEDCYVNQDTTKVCYNQTCQSIARCDAASAVCPPHTPLNGTTCGASGTGDVYCDLGDICLMGVCTTTRKPDFTPCNDATFNDCNGPDYCLGGRCQANVTAANVPCGNKLNVTCHNTDRCDGNGVCVSGTWPIGSSCGTSTECAGFQCNVSGLCQLVPLASGTPCGGSVGRNVTPPLGVCWDTWRCNGAGTCETRFKPVNTVCGPANQSLPCDADDLCDGKSDTCYLHYKVEYANQSVICDSMPGSDCIQPSYCQINNVTCPPLKPCTNCSKAINSVQCIGMDIPVPAVPTFLGCMWCGGEWGCRQRTMAKTSVPAEQCSVAICPNNANVSATSHDNTPLTAVTTAQRTCPVINMNSSSIEIVQYLNLPRAELITSLCFLIDVQSRNTITTDLGSGAGVAVPISVFATIYESAVGPVPGPMISNTTQIDIYVTERGLFKYTLDLKALNWGVYPTKPVFVGVRFVNSCPNAWLSPLTVPGTGLTPYLATRNPVVNPPAWTSKSGNDAWAIQTNTWPGVCGDNFVSYQESCDKGVNPDWRFFCINCTCQQQYGSIPDSVTGGCKCNVTLPGLDAHNFTAPPFIRDLKYTAGVEKPVSFWIQLPQAQPLRYNASAHLVDAKLGTFLPPAVAASEMDNYMGKVMPWDEIGMIPYPCYWLGFKEYRVEDLIQFGKPLVFVHDTYADYYAIQFAVLVEWCEEVVMYRADPSMRPNITTQRCMNARLNFEILVNRDVNVNSTITIVDSTVMWAYIKRGFLIIPGNGVPALFQIMLETCPKTDGILIDNTTFKWVGKPEGKIQSVSNLAQVGPTVGCFQSWNFTVSFNDWKMCSLNRSDFFVLTYLLVAANESVGIAPSQQNMTFYLTTTENWCAAHVNVSLVPRQQTFAYQNWLTSPTAKATDKFLRGSTIFVRIDLLKDYGINVTDLRLQWVGLTGAAVAPAAFVLFPLGTTVLPIYNVSNSPVVDPNWRVTPIVCDYLDTTITPAKMRQQVCYSLYLNMNLLVEKRPEIPAQTGLLTIMSLIEVDFATNMKRSSFRAPEMHNAASSIFLANQAPAQTTEATDAVVVYRVTPAFLAAIASLAFISVLSIVSTVYFVRRRDSATQL